MTTIDDNTSLILSVIQSDERLAKLYNAATPVLPALKKLASIGIDRATSALRGMGESDPTASLTAIREYSTPAEYDAFVNTIASNACSAVVRQIEAEEEGTELFWRVIVGILVAAIGAV
jgi:hypothetical protein